MKNVFLFGKQKSGPRMQSRSLAMVTGITGNEVYLQIAGDSAPREKSYGRLASYSPTVGDRVYIAPISGTYIVIGKVVHNA